MDEAAQKRVLKRVDALEQRVRYDAVRTVALLVVAVSLLVSAAALMVDWVPDGGSDAQEAQTFALLYVVFAALPGCLFVRLEIINRWIPWAGVALVVIGLLLVWAVAAAVDDVDEDLPLLVLPAVAGLLVAGVTMFAPPRGRRP
jgi:peptidoglycan/LPS O-acetylase OafA/YrhL